MLIFLFRVDCVDLLWYYNMYRASLRQLLKITGSRLTAINTILVLIELTRRMRLEDVAKLVKPVPLPGMEYSLVIFTFTQMWKTLQACSLLPSSPNNFLKRKNWTCSSWMWRKIPWSRASHLNLSRSLCPFLLASGLQLLWQNKMECASRIFIRTAANLCIPHSPQVIATQASATTESLSTLVLVMEFVAAILTLP